MVWPKCYGCRGTKSSGQSSHEIRPRPANKAPYTDLGNRDLTNAYMLLLPEGEDRGGAYNDDAVSGRPCLLFCSACQNLLHALTGCDVPPEPGRYYAPGTRCMEAQRDGPTHMSCQHRALIKYNDSGDVNNNSGGTGGGSSSSSSNSGAVLKGGEVVSGLDEDWEHMSARVTIRPT